jgi:hypothetical protein
MKSLDMKAESMTKALDLSARHMKSIAQGTSTGF